jgi:hypothetical protein
MANAFIESELARALSLFASDDPNSAGKYLEFRPQFAGNNC